MKILVDKSKKQYDYYCDRCNVKISFKDKTLHQVHIKTSSNTSRKCCDLCPRCYRALVRGVFKNHEKK